MLAERKVEVLAERSSKDPLATRDVIELIRSVDEIWIARGARVEKLPAQGVKPGDLKGPTGKFRAPMLRRGRRLLVGFHAASIRELAD